MGARIGVDVGSTTVVAAASDGDGEPRLLEFEGEDGPPGAMTASLVLRADGSARAGGEADRALDADPHLGARGPIAHLESGSAVLELVGGPVPVVALVGELLARPLRVASRAGGAAPEAAVLAMPSSWPADGRRARALRAAAALAGLPPVTLVPAAVAAAELSREAETETVLVCDVGGRTTQLAIVDLEPEARRLLAATELAVGTDLFDETLYLEVVRLLEEDDPESARRLEDLHMLTAFVEAAPDAREWAACQAELARAVRHCREALACADAAPIAVGPPLGLALELERDRVAALLETELQAVAAAARAQVDQARAATPQGRGHAGPRRAVIVGGGARAPGLQPALAAELDLPVAIAGDPLTAVARGALLVAERMAPAPAQPAREQRRPPRRAPAPTALRTVLDEVAAAVLAVDDVVAIVRHDGHQRVVRTDAQGRVGAAHGIGGSDVVALAATVAAVVAASSAEASVFAPGMRPLATVERPLLAAAGKASAWVVGAGDEQAPLLALTTLAIAGRAARSVGEERLGLAPAEGRGRLRPAPRGVRSAPPRAHWSADGDALLFAVAARGRGGRPAQLLGEAGAAGLGAVATKADGPPWVTARARTQAGAIATLTAATGVPARLALGDTELAAWPAGVRVSLTGGRDRGGLWVVAARHARWEALRIEGGDLVLARGGDGVVEHARAAPDGLWLVCESGGERRLVCVTPDGELQRLGALRAPLEPLGRLGGEALALAGGRDAPRRLVALG